jgi:ABC-type spermidine/putrescine transport system permease subunit I
MTRVRELIVAFGRFWWEFLIGENPDAFIGALVVIGLAFALRHDRAAAVVVVPLVAIVFLTGSTYRARKRTQG